MFNAVVEQDEFMEALKAVRGTVGKGKDVSILNDKCVYMEVIADYNGKPLLRIITSNTCEISDILVDIIKGDIGTCCLIEYELLFNIISTIDNTLELVLTNCGDYKLNISYTGRKKPIVINGLPSDNYIMPPIPINQSDIILPMSLLKEGLDLGSALIHNNATYPVFNCISIKIVSGMLEFSAFDSITKGLLIYKKAVANVVDGSFFVECIKIKKMISGFDISKDVIIHISANNIVFEQDSLSLTARLTSGTFPDIACRIPKQYKAEVIFNKDEMLSSLKRAILMTESIGGMKSVVLNIDAMFIAINLNSNVGVLNECVIGTLNGPSVQMSFLVEQLSDAIMSINDDKIKMCFYDRSCTILKPVSVKGYEHSRSVQAVTTV